MKFIDEYKLYNTETSTLIHTSKTDYRCVEIYRSIKGKLYILIKEINIQGIVFRYSILASPKGILDFLIEQKEIDLCLQLFPNDIEEV